MKRTLSGIVTVILAVSAISFAGEFKITDEFVDYIKASSNPQELGLKKDGKFYPYSTRYGRKIGYCQKVMDKKFYSQGWPKALAEKQLRADLEKELAALSKYVNKNYPQTPFDSLSEKSQHILLDYAHSEGVGKISPEFYKTVIAQDWNKLIYSYMYVRMTDGWSDQEQNKAFADRWIYSIKPLTKLPDIK